MWFIFGFITFISFSVYFGYKRLNASWQGEQRETGDISYKYKEESNKHGLTAVLAGIDGSQGYDYSFKHETGIDRFFKSIGVSVEYQVGDKEFDDKVYIISDDDFLHEQVSANSKITDAVKAIFDLADSYKFGVKEIRNNYGRLWVRLKPLNGYNSADIPSMCDGIVSQLAIITREFQQIPLINMERNKWRDPFVFKAAVILAISTALAVNGAVHLFRLMFTKIPFTVDDGKLLTDAVYLGIAIAVMLILAAFYLLGRTARTHLVLIELIFIGTFGAISTSFSELRDINMELDESRVEKYETVVRNKRISRGRRSTSYYLYVDDWNNRGGRLSIQVSSGDYDKFQIGHAALVSQRNGYLDYRWVEVLSGK